MADMTTVAIAMFFDVMRIVLFSLLGFFPIREGGEIDIIVFYTGAGSLRLATAMHPGRRHLSDDKKRDKTHA